MVTLALGSSTREAYGRALARLGADHPEIVVLDADLAKSTQTIIFGRQFPDRFFYVGIGEQNMISMAAGLAACGKTVFASTFAVFSPGRCFDQIRISIAQPHLNVKLVSSHQGITVGEDGKSAHALEDLALMSSLFGVNIIVPADEIEMEQAVEVAATTPGPFYIRSGRPKVPIVYDEGYRFVLGKAAVMREGTDATIVANGYEVAQALQAWDELQTEGITCRVLSMPTLRPLDTEAIGAAAGETGAIVTAEEHGEIGGLGTAVAHAAAQLCPVPMEIVAVRRYTESGKPEELVARYGIGAPDIAAAVRRVVERKRRRA